MFSFPQRNPKFRFLDLTEDFKQENNKANLLTACAIAVDVRAVMTLSRRADDLFQGIGEQWANRATFEQVSDFDAAMAQSEPALHQAIAITHAQLRECAGK